jgi:hypothetical protein
MLQYHLSLRFTLKLSPELSLDFLWFETNILQIFLIFSFVTTRPNNFVLLDLITLIILVKNKNYEALHLVISSSLLLRPPVHFSFKTLNLRSYLFRDQFPRPVKQIFVPTYDHVFLL